MLILFLKFFGYFRIKDCIFADCNSVNFVNTEVADVIAYFLCVLSQELKRDPGLSSKIRCNI